MYKSEVEPNIRKGATLAFAHGFNIHYGQVMPRVDLDVVMVAPKAPGHTVRSTYSQGGGVPMLIALHQNPSGKARDMALVLEAIDSPERDLPDYIEFDRPKMEVKFLRTPKLGDVPYPVHMNPNLVVEFYSR